ncbi:MAG TPA: UDP-3-O-(3-hydroxymyristoyl)glucosamine N-acyltransferase [Blastocatellia bacterium]|nr:UDP-3-O-(3-hydroxymyristoyl)glucosamine N-acyltransferase [Blastocatellia bacterium]HMV83185.1 UDP-3-O-(3-hydroxymyristoyl)glucosamine N-acyltransferase [Blastocatellia bacterium]HMX28872.1 UDP-3-O-(3-hydroxymyristoyl)glucosamine N-acyltransferase [Blastocatellia bacterium]HMY72564.1 UDP-3-O-(3-hydroxymyristoyl)glucosamine N-acyltransferase [Blastocatellia bacterium]HMZ20717.1 UDP-3-O-(3-hydroxymyristoyl)glucosamine N-acyltransferase [Blastocatellia bacterium]
MTLAELAQAIQAELKTESPAAAESRITGVNALSSAQSGEVTFISDAARLSQAQSSAAAAFIVPRKLADSDNLAGRNLLIAKDAKLAFARAIQAFHAKPYQARGVSQDLAVGEDSIIGADCSIHPRVTIGRRSIIGDCVTLHPGVVIGDDCRVGNDTVLFSNVSVYDDTEIGARCRIHSGTVIGADGFSFTPDEQGRQFKLLQTGRVVIEDDVEIGANCCVDRAGFGETRIHRGAKFDNLIQIGHNVEIGEDTVVAALAGFSGGTKIGNRCILAGQIGTNQHITIGDGAIITARTGVTKSVEAGKLMGGMMAAMDYQQWRKSHVLYTRLPELFDRLRKLEKCVDATSGK